VLTLLIQAEEISETLVFKQMLTRLIAGEDVSIFIHHESFKCYITKCVCTMKIVYLFECCVVQIDLDVLEEHITSIFRVKEKAKQETSRISSKLR
jgi:hypothetical protein